MEYKFEGTNTVADLFTTIWCMNCFGANRGKRWQMSKNYTYYEFSNKSDAMWFWLKWK